MGRKAYLLGWGLKSGSRADDLEEPSDQMSSSVILRNDI